MHNSVIEFCTKHITDDMVKDRKIIEVGSHDVNGSIRERVERFGPEMYTGLDICPGPGVDVVADITTYECPVKYHGLICTEVMEHVADWSAAVQSIERLLDDGGWMILTTRSRGYPIHYHPGDYWRFDTEDMQAIFGAWVDNIWTDLLVKTDLEKPGVMVYLRKKCNKTLHRLQELYQSVLRYRRIYSTVEAVRIS